jgi:hypothetical protein
MTKSPSWGGHVIAKRRDSARLALVKWILLAGIPFSVIICGVWLFLAFSHISDLARIDHVAGTWLALADWVHHGKFYPAFYDGEFYAGTRYLGLPIMAIAALGGITGDLLSAGKLLNLVQAVALVAAVFGGLLGRLCPLPVAALVAGWLITTAPVWESALSVRNDALPVALQIAAVSVAYRDKRDSDWLIAALLCALAAAWKLSSIWAGVGLTLWLLIYRRRLLLRFVVTGAACYGVLLLGYQVLSWGRFSENLFRTAFAGSDEQAVSILTRLWLGIQNAGYGVWIEGNSASLLFILPLILSGVFAAYSSRKSDPDLVTLAACAAVMTVVYSNSGASANHLVDILAMLSIFAGRGWRLINCLRHRAFVYAASLLLAIGATWAISSKLVSQETWAAPRSASWLSVQDNKSLNPRPLDGYVEPNALILSEHPYFPVSLGKRATVVDPFMLLRLGRARPNAVEALIARLDAKEFEYVVLLLRLDDENAKWWYTYYHFGLPIAEAMARNYRFSKTLPCGYQLYVRATNRNN